MSDATPAIIGKWRSTREIKTTENYFKFETNNYIRGNVHNVRVGSGSKKKDPIAPKLPWRSVCGAIGHPGSCVKYHTTAEVDCNHPFITR
jgi:hypothetical protein